jgi:hypothetical protein
MTARLNEFAGYTTNADGVTKFRVGSGNLKARIALLTKEGHTDIGLAVLDTPMTRKDALEAQTPVVIATTTVAVADTEDA